MATVVAKTPYARQPLSYKTVTADLLLKKLVSTYPTIFIAIREGSVWGDPELKLKRMRFVTKSNGKRKEFLDAQLLDNPVMRFAEALAPAYKAHLPEPDMSDQARLKLMKKIYGSDFDMDTLVTVMTFTDWMLAGEHATPEGGRKLRAKVDEQIIDDRYKTYNSMTPEQLEAEADRLAEKWDEQFNPEMSGPIITITGRHDEDDKEVPLKFNFTIEGLSEWDLEEFFSRGFPLNC